MKNKYCLPSRGLFICLALCLLSACATTNGKLDDSRIVDNSDPYEDTNRSIYSFNEGLDTHFFKPMATAYVDITPGVFRTGVTNFFNNVRYLNVILNSSLQGKLDQGFSDMARFLFNSTLGIGGLFDVATPMGFETHREDLGQTIAIWGSKQGPYLVLPAFGPNTARDTPDLVSSYFLNPLSYISSTFSFPATFLYILNTRANLLEASNFRDSAAIDSYSFTREAYLQSRRNLIYDGNPPAEDFDDIFDVEFGLE